MTLTIQTPPRFNLWWTIFSHGWCTLPPFSVGEEQPAWLRRTELLGSGTIVSVKVTGKPGGVLALKVENDVKLTRDEKCELKLKMRSMFRLDEDYEIFYREVRRYPEFLWALKHGAGRLLRAPSVFEDVVKMICTTNCTWGLTQLMVRNMTEKLGRKAPDGSSTFPEPRDMANQTEAFFRREIKSGYRSPYLIELAQRVVAGNLDIESWRTSELPAEELFKEIRSVKGVGPYAAGNLLKLLGRYEYLALDSWCRSTFCMLHGRKKVSDAVIEKYYAKYGRWKGLFLWLELTKNWYDNKFPV